MPSPHLIYVLHSPDIPKGYGLSRYLNYASLHFLCSLNLRSRGVESRVASHRVCFSLSWELLFNHVEVRPFFGYIITMFDRYDSNIAVPSSWFEFIVSMNVAGRRSVVSMCVRRLGRVVTSGKGQGYGGDNSTNIKLRLTFGLYRMYELYL